MSNFDYHAGYRPAPKKRIRTHLVKLWFKKIIYAAVVVSLGVFFFETFISNPTPKYKASISQSLDSTPNKDISTSLRNAQNEVTGDLDQVTLNENHEEKFPETLKNNILIASVIDDTPALNSYSSKNPINSISVDSGKNKDFQKAEDEINYKAKEEQNIQIAYIIKQTSTNKVMIPNSATNARITTTKNIETVTIETKPEVILTSNQSIMKLTQSSESKPQNIDDIKDLQDIYQKSLDQLTNEAELENLFKNNYSKFHNIIEL